MLVAGPVTGLQPGGEMWLTISRSAASGCVVSGFQPGLPGMEFATHDVGQPQFQHFNLFFCQLSAFGENSFY